MTTLGGSLSGVAVNNAGTIGLGGDGYYGNVSTLAIGGVVTLSGSGTVRLAEAANTGGNTSTQVITGMSAGATLDNVGNTIIGYGQLGHGQLSIINEVAGTIEGTFSTLVVDTGANVIVNHGLLEGSAGTLQANSAIANSGTILALGGAVVLNGAVADSGLVQAGAGGVLTLRALLTDAGGASKVLAGGAMTLDGGGLVGGTFGIAATGSVTVTTLGGSLSGVAVNNAGTIGLGGDGYYGSVSTLAIGGVVTLSGSGTVRLAETANTGGNTSTQVITGSSASDTLDNIGNTIIGYGQLGHGQLSIINEAAGTIDAVFSTLVVNTGSGTFANHGTIQAVGGTLEVQSVLDSTAGGKIAAVDNTGTIGAILLDGGTLRGGAISTDASDPNSALRVTGNGGTLDGTAGAVQFAAGSQATVIAGQTLTLRGAIANAGKISVGGDGYYGNVGRLAIDGMVTLSGGGTVALAETSNASGNPNPQVISGASAGDTLDNVDNTISGYGRIGAGALTLINEAQGKILLGGGTIAPSAFNNAGLLKGFGTLAAPAIVNTGLVEATGGTLVAATTVAGLLQIDAASTLELDGAEPGTATVVFTGAGAVLRLGDAADFNGKLQGFGATATIDLLGITASSIGFAGNVLTVSQPAGAPILLNFSGGAPGGFGYVPDGSGTDIVFTFSPPPTVAISDAGPSLTNKAVQTISGSVTGLYAAGAAVAIFDGAIQIGSTVAGGDGSWSTAVTLAGDGSHSLTAVATDTVSNTGTSTPVVDTLDTTPPSVALAQVSYAGGTLALAGTLADLHAAGGSIAIVDNGGATLFQTSVATGGAWNASFAAALAGDNLLTAVVTDAAGNSAASGSFGVHEGTAGNDAFTATAGGNIYDGNGGHDTLAFGIGYRGVASSGNASGADLITSLGHEHLSQIAEADFIDGRLVFDLHDTAAQVVRLYQAALQRTPDQGGLDGWVSQIQAGAPLDALAQGFIGSQEFIGLYGANLSDEGFVTALYKNALLRLPDPAGLAGWETALSTGESRADVLIGFSESPENIANTAPLLQAGVFVDNLVADQVARLYDTTLGRKPDIGGLAGWTNLIQTGQETLSQVIDGFTGSQEFQSTYGALNDTQFVTTLYANTLHRAPDAPGLAGWVDLLNSGTTRSGVVYGFSESPEHIGNTAPFIVGGIQLA